MIGARRAEITPPPTIRTGGVGVASAVSGRRRREGWRRYDRFVGLTALGGPALVLAAGAACASAVASWDGQRRGRPASVAWGRRGLATVFGLLSVAVVVLGGALVGQDYSLAYVADNASRDTTWPYRLAGMWGGMSGSLLLWTWLLAGWGLVASRSVRRRLPDLAGVTQAVLALEAVVFLGLLVTATRPFATLAVPALDGGGLTPILRHPAMLYHPPAAVRRLRRTGRPGRAGRGRPGVEHRPRLAGGGPPVHRCPASSC